MNKTTLQTVGKVIFAIFFLVSASFSAKLIIDILSAYNVAVVDILKLGILVLLVFAAVDIYTRIAKEITSDYRAKSIQRELDTERAMRKLGGE